jgi:16S rRNA (cytidine1402-2'-O)-methyltransferase
MSGTLYLVSTPIGNLEDITMRALRVLREVPLIAAEDTRRTGRLLHHYQIDTRTTSFHAHNEREKAPRLLEHLAGGASLALVTDAGTPVVSDPGQSLVQEALARGIRVEAIPGASAILAALVSSGMGAEGFVFLGFPPPRTEARKKWFAEAATEARPLVIFEAPHRLVASLQDARAMLGDREAVVGRELTKLHEEFVRGTLSLAIDQFSEREPRGEFTLVIAPAAEGDDAATGALAELSDDDAWIELGRLRDSGISRREAVARMARRTGHSPREVYARAERGKANAAAIAEAAAAAAGAAD